MVVLGLVWSCLELVLLRLYLVARVSGHGCERIFVHGWILVRGLVFRHATAHIVTWSCRLGPLHVVFNMPAVMEFQKVAMAIAETNTLGYRPIPEKTIPHTIRCQPLIREVLVFGKLWVRPAQGAGRGRAPSFDATVAQGMRAPFPGGSPPR